jgi:SAM-dependent methyltransferase
MTPPASFDSQEYWIARHEQFAGSHEATGLLGSSRRANAILYDLRQRALLESLNTADLAGARVLDAGCGLGDFSRLYSERGAQVYGCDVSPRAVKHCRSHGPGTFEPGRIVDVPRLFPTVRFDIVHCFDVLYHLVDDREWEESLRTLDAVSAPTAVWYITEIVRPRPGADHIRARQRPAYTGELARYRRMIVSERRLHWLLGVRPLLHSRFPELSARLEPLCRIWPAAALARVALWRVVRSA